MSTFLFDKIIFGPVKSRRLGVSLGVNLLPSDHKVCTFNCVYCECGFNPAKFDMSKLPPRNKVYIRLEKKLKEMVALDEEPNVITFAGNGEPTLHPEFAEIIKDTVKLRDLYCSSARIAVLTNSTNISKPEIFKALMMVDQNILKIDSAIQDTIKTINQVSSTFRIEDLVSNFMKFRGEMILQTMFVKGEYNGKKFDNTTDEEVDALLEVYKQVNPNEVMVYSIARDTPIDSIQKIDKATLEQIAKKIKALGIKVSVS